MFLQKKGEINIGGRWKDSAQPDSLLTLTHVGSKITLVSVAPENKIKLSLLKILYGNAKISKDRKITSIYNGAPIATGSVAADGKSFTIADVSVPPAFKNKYIKI